MEYSTYYLNLKDNLFYNIIDYQVYKNEDSVLHKIKTCSDNDSCILESGPECKILQDYSKKESFENIKLNIDIKYLLKTDDGKYLYIEKKKDSKPTFKLGDKPSYKTIYKDGEFVSSSTPFFYLIGKKMQILLTKNDSKLSNRKININLHYNKKFFKPHTKVKDYKNVEETDTEIENAFALEVDQDTYTEDNKKWKIISPNDKYMIGDTIEKAQFTTVSFPYHTSHTDELNEYKKEIQNIQLIYNNLVNEKEDLDSKTIILNNNISKTVKEIDINRTKLITKLDFLEQHSQKNINQEIKNIFKLIFDNYKMEKQIIEYKTLYQKKVQFSIMLSTDKEYVTELKNQIETLQFEINRLKLLIKKKERINYDNIEKTDKVIEKINTLTQIIEEKLNNINKKETFNNNDTEFKTLYDKNTQNINKINILIIDNKKKYNVKYYLEKLYMKLIRYNTLLEKEEEILQDAYIINYNKFEKELFILKNNLVNEFTKNDSIFKLLKSKFELKNIKIVNIKFNQIEREALELKLMDIENEKDTLNISIKEVNLIDKAQHQFQKLKNMDSYIIRHRLMNTMAYEGFQNKNKIETITDIINRNGNGFSNVKKDTTDEFKSGECLYNNENISIEPIPGEDVFKININNKCLEVRGDNNYYLSDCQNLTQKQFFEPVKISNRIDAININKVAPHNENIKYPFYQMVSSISGNCVSLDDNGVSIMPCDTNNIQQHWKMKKNEKLCLDN